MLPAVLPCSDDAVVRRFAKLPGVIDLGGAESRHKRRYRVLRIPKAFVEEHPLKRSSQRIKIAALPRANLQRRTFD